MAADENQDEKWSQWTKKRTFVREVAGKYDEVYRELLKQPRVYKTKVKPYKGGPIQFHKRMIDPQFAKITQTIETHVDVIAPGGYGQKHGHMNSAVFYVLEGKGHDVHDGIRYDWESGDAMVVENGCVHQHFNDETTRPAHVMVFKAKPMFLFFHLLFQKNVTFPPVDPLPGWEDYKP